MTSFADGDRFARADRLIASEIGDDVVILDVQSGHFFQLNTTAARVWDTLQTPMTVPAICTAMGERFNVDVEQCRVDVMELIQKMHHKGLVTAA